MSSLVRVDNAKPTITAKAMIPNLPTETRATYTCNEGYQLNSTLLTSVECNYTKTETGATGVHGVVLRE